MGGNSSCCQCPNAVRVVDDLPECKLRIFHVNDVYLLDHLPFLRTCVEELSVGFPRNNILTSLAGDFLAPSLLSSLDHGRGMVDVLNNVPVDMVCFGNHESDVPYNSLCQRVQEYKGKWLNSNMNSFTPKLPESHVKELEGGRSILFLGFCIGGGKFSKIYRDGAFGGAAANISPILESVDAVVEEQTSYHASRGFPVDAVVPLTHQDMPEDIEMTTKSCKFPVILGGHDHEEFNEVHNGTLIIKAGQDAIKVAVIDLTWKEGAPARSPPTSVDVKLHDLKSFKPDPGLIDLVKRWQRPAEELKLAVLDEVKPGSLSSVGVRAKENSMATFIISAMRTACRAEGGLINAGGVRGDKVYETGQITFADLSKECPFPSTNVVVRIDGKTLSDAVAKSREKWRASPPETDALALHTDDEMKVDPRTGAVTHVKGIELIDTQQYEILIDSYLMDANPVLKEYKRLNPEQIPPDDSGAPALPTLVQYFGERVWAALIRDDHNGGLHLDEIDKILGSGDQFADSSAELNEEQLLALIVKKLGPNRGSRVLASTCLAFADEDKSGGVSRIELRKFLVQGLAARLGICVVISIDKLLYNDQGIYEFTKERCADAWRRCYEQFKELAEANMCRKIVCMCGCPGVGKSTWLRVHGPRMGTDCIFFDDLLYSRAKRKSFLDGLDNAKINVPVEIVCIEREFKRTLKSVSSREFGGVRVPQDAMERFKRDYERPSVEEGFGRVRIFENTYNDDTGQGGYVLMKETPRIFSADNFLDLQSGKPRSSQSGRARIMDACESLLKEVKSLIDSGECDRIIAVACVSPLVKVAWIRANIASNGGERTIFITNLLHSVNKRQELLNSMKAENMKTPVEMVALEPDENYSIDNEGNQIQASYKRPKSDEGFAKVTVIHFSGNPVAGTYNFR